MQQVIMRSEKQCAEGDSMIPGPLHIQKRRAARSAVYRGRTCSIERCATRSSVRSGMSYRKKRRAVKNSAPRETFCNEE